MAHPRQVVLGCDPGEQHTAFGVVGPDTVRHSSLLVRGKTPWDAYCVAFQDELTRLIATCAVEILAIENFRWYGEYAKVEPPIRELIGIARTFSRTIPVKVIDAREWSYAITGRKPATAKAHGLNAGRLWKHAIRVALATRFQLMGINLTDIVGKDEGNHRTDSLALSLYCQDIHYVTSHARRAPHA
jgi:hypothetical protein